MKIIIGSDHAGFPLKEFIKTSSSFSNITWTDVGCDSAEKSCDYPEFAQTAAKKVQSGESDRGILVCGSGIGMSITANRFKNVRAALCITEEMAELSRRHNDSNILCLGARLIDGDRAVRITETWLKTGFEGDRHIKRLEKIEAC